MAGPAAPEFLKIMELHQQHMQQCLTSLILWAIKEERKVSVGLQKSIHYNEEKVNSFSVSQVLTN